MKAKLKSGKCGLCGNSKDEGVEITIFWFIKAFVCETCWSRLFRLFRKNV